MRRRTWKQEDLIKAAEKSTSVRQVLFRLNLKQAGGNYSQIKKYLKLYKIDTKHFTGRAWNKGMTGFRNPRIPLDEILVINSEYQSFKLKKRLFISGLKFPKCEECGWAEISNDGRIPLELDHINGNNKDNRLTNLRILCPNCHSLKPTHRGKNSKK